MKMLKKSYQFGDICAHPAEPVLLLCDCLLHLLHLGGVEVVELLVASLERVDGLLGELHALPKLVDCLWPLHELSPPLPHRLTSRP